jgi:DNA-binding Lrp family transcriptional regulator
MNHDLDRIDYRILALLQNNARLSNKELAAAVDLAPSSCLSRVQRLKDAGVLLGFHAQVAPEALGIGVQAMVAVRMRQHNRNHVKTFMKHLRAVPEIREVFYVTGAHDFLVHVVARDMGHLKDLALDVFTNRPEVAHIETSLVYEYLSNPVTPALTPQAPKAGTRGRV